jgi:hypothetical protein
MQHDNGSEWDKFRGSRGRSSAETEAPPPRRTATLQPNIFRELRTQPLPTKLHLQAKWRPHGYGRGHVAPRLASLHGEALKRRDLMYSVPGIGIREESSTRRLIRPIESPPSLSLSSKQIGISEDEMLNDIVSMVFYYEVTIPSLEPTKRSPSFRLRRFLSYS